MIHAARAPNDYVAQELVRLSQAPVWDRAHRGSCRAMGLRIFACASPNGYVVMPGGLARVASAADTQVISMQRGGSSKDAGCSPRAGQHFQPPAPLDRAQDLVRSGSQSLEPGGREPVLVRPTASAATRPRGSAHRPGPVRRQPSTTTMSARARWCWAAAPRQHLAGAGRARRRGALGRAARGHQWTNRTRARERPAATAARGIAASRAAVARQLAHHQPPHPGPDAAPGAAGLLRSAGRARCRDRRVGDALGLHAGQHDARPGLALPLHRPQARAAALAVRDAQADGRRPRRWTSWLLRFADSIITYRAPLARPEWLPVLDLLILDEATRARSRSSSWA